MEEEVVAGSRERRLMLPHWKERLLPPLKSVAVSAGLPLLLLVHKIHIKY